MGQVSALKKLSIGMAALFIALVVAWMAIGQDNPAGRISLENLRTGQSSYLPVDRSGVNTNFGISVETVWNGVGLYTGFNATAAEIVEVFSSDPDDTALGTGAKSVVLIGLDADHLRQIEVVALNGTTPVLSSLSYIRLGQGRVQAVGSSGFNEGTITARQSVTTANVFFVMPEERNATQMALLTIPGNQVGYVLSSEISLGGGPAGSAVFAVRLHAPGLAASIISPKILTISGSSNFIEVNSVPRGPIPPKTDIDLVVRGSMMNLSAAGSFRIVLIPSD